jgi:lipid II:glycine glycyltransferase (peptidoglycan interpeptide bridge formation enzyme)
LNIRIETLTASEVQYPTHPITIADDIRLYHANAKAFGWDAVKICFGQPNGKPFWIPACKKKKRIVMTPHFSYGPAIDVQVASEIMQALSIEGYACEWRHFEKITDYTFSEKITTCLKVSEGDEAVFQSFSSNLRRKIRKSQRNQIEVRAGGTELLSDFYLVYSKNMHRLGSPAMPLKWFKILTEQCDKGHKPVWCCYLEGKVIGAAFLVSYKGFAEACWVSTLNEYNHLYTSYSLYWAMIQYACSKQSDVFSFGRSSFGSGVHIFKRQWGGYDLPLVWNYNKPQRASLKSFHFLPAIWKRIPYPLTKIIGPIISPFLY